MRLMRQYFNTLEEAIKTQELLKSVDKESVVYILLRGTYLADYTWQHIEEVYEVDELEQAKDALKTSKKTLKNSQYEGFLMYCVQYEVEKF